MEELSKKIDPIMVELNRAYKEKYPYKGSLDKRVIDVPMYKTQKVQIFTVGETDKVESDVVFVLSKTRKISLSKFRLWIPKKNILMMLLMGAF